MVEGEGDELFWYELGSDSLKMLDHAESDTVFGILETTNYPETGPFDIRKPDGMADGIDRIYLTVNVFNGGVPTPGLGKEALTARDARLRMDVHMWQEIARFRVRRYILEYTESATEFVPDWSGENHIPRPLPSRLAVEIADGKWESLDAIVPWHIIETPSEFIGAEERGNPYTSIMIKHAAPSGEPVHEHGNPHGCPCGNEATKSEETQGVSHDQ